MREILTEELENSFSYSGAAMNDKSSLENLLSSKYSANSNIESLRNTVYECSSKNNSLIEPTS